MSINSYKHTPTHARSYTKRCILDQRNAHLYIHTQMYPDARLHVVWTSVCSLKPQQTETTSCVVLAEEGTMRTSRDTTVQQLHGGPGGWSQQGQLPKPGQTAKEAFSSLQWEVWHLTASLQCSRTLRQHWTTALHGLCPTRHVLLITS